MPPAAGAAAAIASSVAAGAATIGAAVSTGLAAVGGIGGLATGLTIASSAVSLVGMATGSKTLQKIGMIGGMVGGLGMGASALSGAATAGGATKAASAGFSAFPSSGGAAATMSNIGSIAEVGKGAITAGVNSAAGVLPAATKTGSTNVVQRMNELLKKYDTTANILGGMGQGFVDYQQNKIRKEQNNLLKSKFDFEKEQYNKKQSNLAAVPTIPSSIGSGIRRADGSPLLNMGTAR